LAFGDLADDGNIDDLIVTNNKDTAKVLVTVASVIKAFLTAYPDRLVFIKGSTDSRTRLYRIVIANYYHLLREEFNIQGFVNGDWNSFQPGIDCEAFIVRLKKPVAL
ncbi:MAG TPA: hypothetical protein VF473_11080, partial [Cyclobacteriaceae bacterium]